MTRETALASFLSENGWGDAERKLLAADASFRHYDRLIGPRGRAVLMNAPPDKEDVRPFLTIARYLQSVGLSAPAILAENIPDGFLLLEDFGDDTYTTLLRRGRDEDELYALAVDVLIALHRATVTTPDDVPYYSDDLLCTEASLLVDWYMPAVMNRPVSTQAREKYLALWRDIFAQARDVPSHLILRDYHVDNLMRVTGKEGLKQCGLLDFQDGVTGPVSYDLMSLMEDARRDIDADLISRMKDRYLAAFPSLDREAFDRSWAILAAGRHAKIIGIFTRLCARDSKPHYLAHIPRLWRLFESSLTHPVLAPMKDWVDANIPEDMRYIPEIAPGQGVAA